MLPRAPRALEREHTGAATAAVRLGVQVPVQVASAVLMLLSAGWAEARLNAADIWAITALFFFLVLLAATQDIAVDGWALTLLSRHNIGYACWLQPQHQAPSCRPLSGECMPGRAVVHLCMSFIAFRSLLNMFCMCMVLPESQRSNLSSQVCL